MIAVVIPCYRVKNHILSVLAGIGPEVSHIFAVDDACPDKSGAFIEQSCQDPRVKVIFHDINCGVGGATISGYHAALAAGAKYIVKIDGDGQMNPALIPYFVAPLQKGSADYVKGNRFFDIASVIEMPRFRLIGNASLSFITKISSGYWNVMDPTNGYTAIHADALRSLGLAKLERRYFFESDMLFRLGISRAVVVDLPMKAIYADEKSNMSLLHVLGTFPYQHMKRVFKRIIYTYYLRDFNIGSCHLALGLLMVSAGFFYGVAKWYHGQVTNTLTPTGMVMLASLPIILGFQLLLAFLQYDISNVPQRPLQTHGLQTYS